MTSGTAGAELEAPPRAGKRARFHFLAASTSRASFLSHAIETLYSSAHAGHEAIMMA